ncbi:MAG: hypothetical protein OXH57_01655, partial [Ekhidna sp.]|nr:hypothetical protein [Ekhidna sp.]
ANSVYDAAGNPAAAMQASPANQVRLNDQSPPIISFDAISVLADDFLNAAEDNTSLVITGDVSGAESGQVVTLTLNSRDYLSSGTGGSNVNSSGDWQVTIPADGLQALTDGSAYSIAANVSDQAGNAATELETSDFVYDITPPDVTINQASSQRDPTSTNQVIFDVMLTEPVVGFINTDVDLSSSTAGVSSSVVSISQLEPTIYMLSVTGMTSDGEVIAGLGAGVFTDLAGNDNNPSTSTDNTVTFDDTPPAIRTAPSATDTTAIGFTINVESNETGSVHYVVVADGNGMPTGLQVRAGENDGGNLAIASGRIGVGTANTPVQEVVNILEADTSYEVYLLAEDEAGNLSAVVRIAGDAKTRPFDTNSSVARSTGTAGETVNIDYSIHQDVDLIVTEGV